MNNNNNNYYNNNNNNKSDSSRSGSGGGSKGGGWFVGRSRSRSSSLATDPYPGDVGILTVFEPYLPLERVGAAHDGGYVIAVLDGPADDGE